MTTLHIDYEWYNSVYKNQIVPEYHKVGYFQGEFFTNWPILTNCGKKFPVLSRALSVSCKFLVNFSNVKVSQMAIDL